MKKILTTLGILLCVVLVLSVPTKRLISQSQFDISRAVWKVLTEGILLPDLETSAVYYNDFFDLPDTTSGYDWDTFGSPGENNVHVIKLSSGDVYNIGADVIKTAGGVLFISSTGLYEDSIIYNIQKTGAPVMLRADKNISFKARILLPDSTDVGAYIGLQYPDSDSIRGHSGTAGIGFEKLIGANAWYFRTDNATSTQSKAMANFTSNADTGWVWVEFVSTDTNEVTAYFNGITDSVLTTYLPFDSILCPTIEVSAGTLLVDNIEAKQIDR